MPFDSLKFCYSWRPYQQRVLNAIDEHLDDFLNGEKAFDKEWVSRDIRKPGIFTSVTYQALHAQFADDYGGRR